MGCLFKVFLFKVWDGEKRFCDEEKNNFLFFGECSKGDSGIGINLGVNFGRYVVLDLRDVSNKVEVIVDFVVVVDGVVIDFLGIIFI